MQLEPHYEGNQYTTSSTALGSTLTIATLFTNCT